MSFDLFPRSCIARMACMQHSPILIDRNSFEIATGLFLLTGEKNNADPVIKSYKVAFVHADNALSTVARL